VKRKGTLSICPVNTTQHVFDAAKTSLNAQFAASKSKNKSVSIRIDANYYPNVFD
jgi:hypothetical protein